MNPDSINVYMCELCGADFFLDFDARGCTPMHCEKCIEAEELLAMEPINLLEV
jgi:hypothetical protein